MNSGCLTGIIVLVGLAAFCVLAVILGFFFHLGWNLYPIHPADVANYFNAPLNAATNSN